MVIYYKDQHISLIHQSLEGMDNNIIDVLYKQHSTVFHTVTSIDVLPSKIQVLCEYCTHVSNY